MWRGTKEDPPSLGGLSATCCIPHKNVSTIARHTTQKQHPTFAPTFSPPPADDAFVGPWLLSTITMAPRSSHLRQDLKARVAGRKRFRLSLQMITLSIRKKVRNVISFQPYSSSSLFASRFWAIFLSRPLSLPCLPW